MQALHIDDYRAADAETLVPMWRQSFEYGVGIIDPHSIEEQAAYFRNEVLPKNRVCVARLDQELVGFIAFTDESVTQLHIRVRNIRQGLGKRLLTLAKSESSGSLWLYAFTRNTRACAFYESQGFSVVQRGFEPTWQLEDVKYAWSHETSAA